MDQRRPERNELIISYVYLRKTVDWIGSLLPIVLLAGTAISRSRRGCAPVR